MNRLCVLFLLLLPLGGVLFSQEAGNTPRISLDFRNQQVRDILLSLAELSAQSIMMDDTVRGTATFHFADDDFESALNRFAAYAHLFVTKQDNGYFVSKISIQVADSGNVSVDAEEVSAEAIIKQLSIAAHKTILYDTLPGGPITIRSDDAALLDVLRLLVIKSPEYDVLSQGGGFYVKRDERRLSAEREQGSARIDVAEDMYSIASQRVAFNVLIDNLFKRAKKEYLLLFRNSATIENVYYENKDFESLLRLVLDTANADYKIENDVYYIFEVQKRDIVKKLKDTVTVKLSYISATELQNILPSELNASGFLRVDKSTNSVFVTGSEEEIQPILAFLQTIDVPHEDRYYKTFSVKNIPVKDALALLPKALLLSDAVIIPATPSFVLQVDTMREQEITQYLELIDKRNKSYPVHLRYIKSEELIKYMPPSALKDSVAVTGDTSLVFFTGTEEERAQFMQELALIDQPKQQIRYQLLVIQHQKSDSLNHGSNATITKTDSPEYTDFTATLSNLVNVDFDIVSQFGYQFAVKLNAELGENKAKILADTTLNAISGEEISFQNTNTYRYRDVGPVDNATGLFTSTTRELTSGLTLQINGWVSGDEMITVGVTAKVSKQGAVPTSNTTTTNPPSTSEKSVTTHVRSKSGEPVIIGGLIQTDTDVIEKRVPFLGKIPLLGLLFKTKQITVEETEMVIYLVPFVQKTSGTVADSEKRMRTYYQKYVSGESAS
jgi:type II secretory pathway component GspD/PulD (secretin)